MMTQMTLLHLHRSLATERVLTVYVDLAARNPADRDTWRTELDHALNDIRTGLAGSARGERVAFDQCVVHLDHAIEQAVQQSSVAWCAFITPSGVEYAHALPVHVRTAAMWRIGAWVSPCIRALRETEPVWVAVADSRKVDVYQYQAGTVASIDTLRAHHPVDEPAHMGAPASAHFHQGTHGASGHDAAQRSLLAGRDRMLDEAAHRLDSLAPELGLIIVGGIPGVAAQLADRLRSFPRRVVTRVSLDVHASHASIVTAARSAACVLHGARDSAEIAELVELANDDLATVGEQATALALELGRVWTLYITPRYLQASENDAEVAVRSALDQHAEVVVVSSEAALHLDEIGGIAARARYRASATVERAPGAAIRPVSSST